MNRAGDDAAGLSISEKMWGQIFGLHRASANTNDSISLVQTAEGALTEVNSILNRGRKLAVQATNSNQNIEFVFEKISTTDLDVEDILIDTQKNTNNESVFLVRSSV